MSKTTFYQIFECISLKVLDTGSLQIFANPCKFASQLCKKKFLNVFLFFDKISLPQTAYFQFQIFDTNWPSLLHNAGTGEPPKCWPKIFIYWEPVLVYPFLASSNVFYDYKIIPMYIQQACNNIAENLHSTNRTMECVLNI